ncbi:MAG: peptidylprolyl isomerase [Gemmatimonadaceae bacterium]|nr:peptidylprolyl isomerase [Gemmatimonadaceae bacterium]
MRRNSFLLLCAALLISAEAGAQGSSGSLTRAQVSLWAKLLQMTDGRTLDTALVRQGLNSTVPALRANAALAIGQVGRAAGLAGLSILRASLADRDANVVSNAAYALGLLGDSASAVPLRILLSKQAAVGMNAAWALGTIGSAARPAILSALADNSIEPMIKAQVLLAAAKLRPLPVAELRPYLASRNASLVWAASYAIARGRAVPGARDMITLAGNRTVATTCRLCNPVESEIPYYNNSVATHRARAEAARTLVKNVAGDSLAVPAMEVLKRLTTDAHPHVRINAVRSLSTFGPAVRSYVVAATRDADPNVRIAAAQVIGGVLDTSQVGWAGIWARDTSFMYRTSLAASAAAAGVTLPSIKAWGDDADWRYRAALAGALGSLPARTALDPAVVRMLEDPDARVRSTALSVAIPRDTLKVTPAIRAIALRMLADPSVDVRTTAIDALSRNPSTSDLDLLLASYEKSRADSANDARISAVQYLAELWKRDSTNFPALARQSLARIGAPTDPLERSAAGTSSLFAAWPSILPPAKNLAWYESVVRTLIAPALRGQTPRLTVNTARGPIVLELFAVDAPLTVNNIMTLAKSGYYKGTRFHRVVPNFVAQDGDPTGTGGGGPGYAIRDEMNPHRYERGVLGMALSGPDTGGSQYFITHSPQPHLDGGYTVFGRVLSGWSALDAIVQGDLIKSVSARQ